ncbi:hypothetical protein F5Y01DRAFT_291740 [Xylaria sp. FL0043]|nr:hypothetical protein F5Y01DRAFT_291740 [Xylaria sp. FL0043]
MSVKAQEVGSISGAEIATQQQDGEDDDDLSITSTNVGENDSEKEWEVDDILAERQHPDDPDASQYLIKWEGFKLEDCTWEPLEHLGDGLLQEWEQHQTEIAAGNREMFDLALYDAACAERIERHRRRNAKRRRLGLPLTHPFLSEYIDDTPVASPANQDSLASDDEAQETDKRDRASIPPLKPKATISTSTPSTDTKAPTPPATVRKVPKQKTFVGLPKESSTSRLSEKGGSQKPSPPAPKASAATSSVTTSGAIRKGSGGTMTGYQGTAFQGRSSVFKTAATKISTPSAAAITNKSSSNAPVSSTSSSVPSKAPESKKLTATRTRQLPASSAGTNVFAGGKQRKKRANLGDVMADSSKAPKAFPNMRIMNLAKKRGIEKGDVVGALSSIPQKFILGNEQVNTIPRRLSLVSPTTGESPSRPETLNSDSASLSTVSKPQVSVKSTQQADTGEALAPPPKRKKSVRFTGEDSEELVSTINDLFDETVHINDDLRSPDADKGAPAPSRKLSLATYQERGQTQTIQKLVKFGHAEAIMVSFGGIIRHAAAWLSAFKAEKALHFSSTCSSFHLFQQKQQLIQEKLSAGTVKAFLPEHTSALRNIAETLQRGSIGLHLVAREYSIIVYPVKCDGWEWLEGDSTKPDEDILLRYLVYLSPAPSGVYPSEYQKDPMELDQLVYPNGGSNPELVGVLTELDFTKIIPQDSKLINKQSYMLLFPTKARQLLGVIMAWLRFHQPDRPIFTIEQPHGWRLFHEAVQAGGGGTIISHAEFTLWKLEKLPGVWRMLESHFYTFWHLDTGENKRPQYPSRLDAVSVPGRLQLTRLFPYGRAFLITPSFAISEPAKLCSFLEWFKSLAVNPGYLIVTCHDFPRFLRKITEEKEWENNSLKRLNPNNPDVDIFLERTRRSKQDIDDHLRAWRLFQEIIERFGDEETTEEIRKVHWLSELIDPSDEQSLVNAYCWWTQLKCDRFRRFYVLGSDPSKIQAAYRYIEIPKYLDTECSDPDIASILLERRLLASELQKEAEKQGTEANIAWSADEVLDGPSNVSIEWRKSICETPFRFPSVLFRTDEAYELERWLECQRRETIGNWSEIHQKPVSWTDWNMAKQFDDGNEQNNRFDTFGSWFKAAPRFTTKRNTWYGLFYTITDTWDEYMPKRRYERHPWIAIYRPKNPHIIRNGVFSKIELFIWDAAAADREKTGQVLLDMQCQLIDYVYSSVAEHYPGCALSDVWYSSSATNLKTGPSDNPLDITCRRIREMFDDGREELPCMDKHLRNRWTPIDPRVWSTGMSPMTRRIKPIEKAWELVPKRIPQTEDDKVKPQRAIWHPVRRGTGCRGTKCLNHLYETCLQARLRDPKCNRIEYRYRPTQEWWADQVAEGRGCSYIRVEAGGKIIDTITKSK